MEREVFKAKGLMDFYYDNENGVCYVLYDRDWFLKQHNNDKAFVDWWYEQNYHKNIYDLMDGIEFYENVNDGGFIDYDGTLAHVFVDGYLSNLGLLLRGISQGKFKVDGETWLEICKEHEVKVNWANK